jgi:hypothetical protein
MKNKLLESTSLESGAPTKKPIVAWAVIVVSGLICLSYALNAVGALTAFGVRPVREVFVTALLTGTVAALAAWIVMGTSQSTFRSRLPISLFLWGVLIIYPITNVLGAFGWYLPPPRYTNSELPAASFLELGRYVFLLIMIVWVMLSHALKVYFSKTTSTKTNPSL